MNQVIEKTTVEQIIHLLQSDTDIISCTEADYNRMRKGQFCDISRFLKRRLPKEDMQVLLDHVRDFEEIVEEEAIQTGFKAGIKLMNEINRL